MDLHKHKTIANFQHHHFPRHMGDKCSIITDCDAYPCVLSLHHSEWEYYLPIRIIRTVSFVGIDMKTVHIEKQIGRILNVNVYLVYIVRFLQKRTVILGRQM